VRQNVDQSAMILIYELSAYRGLGKEFNGGFRARTSTRSGRRRSGG
jgi:hypothetical protein